jgi:glycosyltransferase involved in cell wall biosynthesis
VGDGTAQREALDIPRDAIVVGMIGRLVREKGVMEFLTAATILADRFPNAWFVLVGERLSSDHAVGVDADIAAAQLVLRKRLVLTGPRSDIPQLLAAMDVFCLPSWREGMPRTIIEAMMMGKPVVATDIRGSREEIVANTTGLLVPTRRPEQLADAIGKCITNPVWSRKLGAAGRERAIQLYDEKKIVSLQIRHIAAYTRRTG